MASEFIDLDEIEVSVLGNKKRNWAWTGNPDHVLALVRVVRAALAVHDNEITTIGGEKASNKLSVRNDQYAALTEALAPFRKEAT